MRSRDFCFWLQGFFELENDDTKMPLTAKQTDQEASSSGVHARNRPRDGG